MRKVILAGAAVAALAFSGGASAQQVVRVDDPTPNGAFTGTYDCSFYTYDANGTATKNTKTCRSQGYVAVYQDGVVACNGNENLRRPAANPGAPLSGEPLQGYIWVGPNHAAKSVTGATPGNVAGAGNNLSADDPSTKDVNEAHGPCDHKP